jgi:hypothetical protein
VLGVLFNAVGVPVEEVGEVADDALPVDPGAEAGESEFESLVLEEDPGAAAATPCPVATAAPSPTATAKLAHRAECIAGESDPMIDPLQTAARQPNPGGQSACPGWSEMSSAGHAFPLEAAQAGTGAV